MNSPHSPTRLKQALQRFRDLYGDGEITVLRAPARINILGEHVDYVSYFPTASLPFGSREHEMVMLFRASEDATVRGASTNEAFQPFSFAPGDEGISEQLDQNWETILFSRPTPPPHWSNYVKGSVLFAQWRYGPPLDRGFSFLIDSTIPPNSGASSSSALTVLAGAAIRQVNDIEYKAEELASESSQAEWYTGTRGGALDHTAICLARRGHAVHIRHWNQQVQLIPLPDEEGYRWVTFFSHKADKGREAMLEYNERAAVSRFLIPAFREAGEEVPETVTLDEFARLYPPAFRECERAFPVLVREKRTQPLKILDRMNHHFAEALLVSAAIQMPSESVPVDVKMRTLGGLINLSHQGLRDQYEVSTPEIEQLRNEILHDPLVYGARLMGGGFGGNVLALTPADNVLALIARVQSDYYNPRGRDGVKEGSVMISTSGDGLSTLEL